MLTQQQIQKLKTANSPAFKNSQVMTPEQAKASFSSNGVQPTQSPMQAKLQADPNATNPNQQTNITGDIAKNYTNTIKEAVPNFVTGNMGKIVNDLGKVDPGKNFVVQVGENALQATVDTLGVIFAPFGAVAKAVTDRVSNAIEQNPAIVNSPAMGHIADFVNQVSTPIQKVLQAHPEAATNVGNALNIIITALSGEAGKGITGSSGLDSSLGTVQGVVDAVGSKANDVVQGIADTKTNISNNIGNAVDNVKQNIGGVVNKVTGARTPVLPGSPEELSKISDAISPKSTVKETKIAMEQGRVVQGEKPTLFKSSTPDTLAPSNKVMANAKIIQKKIPGFSDMTPQEQFNALKANGTKVAQDLQPEMQKVPVDSQTTVKANTDWETLKKQQLSDAPKTEEANVIKEQTKFEAVVNKIAQGKNKMTLDDVWQQAKDYDASVKDSVKNATSQSSETLQDQKTRWLENRRILKDVINNTATGLGDTSKSAFQEMSAMFDAQDNLLSKAKLNTTIEPSTVKKILANPVVKVAGKAAGIGTGIELLK